MLLIQGILNTIWLKHGGFVLFNPRCDIRHYKLKPRTNYCAASCSNIIRHFRHKKIIQRHWQTIVPGNPAELLSLIMVNPIPENGILPPFKQNISLMKPQIFGHNENKLSTSISSTRNPAASGSSGSNTCKILFPCWAITKPPEMNT